MAPLGVAPQWVKGRPLRKKYFFLIQKKSSIAIKPEGVGGGKSLMAKPVRE